MKKKDLRPVIPSAKINNTMTAEEQFQNRVLRPIIKLQHECIIGLFDQHLQKAEVDITTFDKLKKSTYLKSCTSRNQPLRNQYIGMIIGLLTEEEFAVYLRNMGEYSRRIMQMISQRIQDTY